MALEEIKVGTTGEYRRKVTKSLLTPGIRSSSGRRVLSTPSLVLMMERACIQAVERVVPEGFTTVGFHIDLKHVAPTPEGMRIRACAELERVDGNKLTFKVVAYDEEKKVGEGIHRRAIIPLAKT
ncbi:MAG: thioesterase family protein [Chloroflexi bacterium]|nr:thioesterase family protein [Chloroflexota bacterium]